MKKSLLFIVAFLIIIFGYFVYQNKLTTKKSVIQQQTITAYLKVYGQKDFNKRTIALGKTALDLTKEKEYWAFYINGKMAEVGAGSYVLKDGDKIEWKLATY